jgi:cellulose synthase/poly-beta-1,6-N-acetylglucosamine synthase-like glycosyltransferase
LHNILPALVATDYPHDSWLLDEGDDYEAKIICAQYGVNYFSRKGIEKYNTSNGKFAAKTKGGNHNAWYDYIGHSYDFVAQIDTDFIPNKNFLNKTLGFFRDPNVAFVGTPQVYGNLDSWIAKGAAQQQYSFYGPILRGLFGYDMTMMLGANHVVRTAALRQIGYYAGHLTEDLLTGMSLHAKQYRSVYVAEQLAIGQGPTTWQAYFNQQLRWAQGCMDILFHHSFKLFRSMSNKKQLLYYFLQQHYFAGLASILGIGLLTIYFLTGISAAAMNIVPMLIVYIPVLLWQYVINRWLQRFYINPDTESGFNWHGMIIGIAVWPIYFMAFLGVLRKKHLTFKVTPKGNRPVQRTDARVFKPHIVIGTVMVADLAAGALFNHLNGFMVFWAVLIILTMYGIAFHQQFASVYRAIRGVTRHRNPPAVIRWT